MLAAPTKQPPVEEELPDKQAGDNGQEPHDDLDGVPASAGVLVPDEGEAVAHHDHVGLRLAVRDRVLCEDQEVEEGDQVGHEHARPRVLEVVAEAGINFHPGQ